MNENDASFSVPIIPNTPLKSPDADEGFGQMHLRENQVNGFIENAAFDAAIIEYDDDYQNNQSVSQAFLDHMRGVLGILKSAKPDGGQLVEVGCGKGDFLEMAIADGHFEVRGFDDAYEGDNPAVEKRFLNADDRIDADIVVLRHVLEHIPQPHEFLQMLGQVFGDAEIYVEVPESNWIWDNGAFFDVTYEHVNYFTPGSLASLFGEVHEQGLLFGDQYQYAVASLSSLACKSFGDAYSDDEAWESLRFESLFPALGEAIATIESEAAEGAVYVWGAATKGVMFCHHLNRAAPTLAQRVKGAVDINPMKSGRYMPSTRLPILDVDAFASTYSEGDLVVIMNPNYRDEILADLAARGLENVRHHSV